MANLEFDATDTASSKLIDFECGVFIGDLRLMLTSTTKK